MATPLIIDFGSQQILIQQVKNCKCAKFYACRKVNVHKQTKLFILVNKDHFNGTFHMALYNHVNSKLNVSINRTILSIIIRATIVIGLSSK